MDTELNQIEAFEKIAQSGSFSRAAQLLHLSQPAISRRIKLLEQTLGTPLFERTKKGVRLTHAGETFRPYAAKVIATVQDGVAAVRSHTGAGYNTLRVALVGTLAGTSLARTLQHFRQDHEEIRLQLRTARSSEVTEMVQNGEVHVGLRYFGDDEEEIETEWIADEALIPLCGADFEPFPVPNVAALADQSLISFPVGTGSSGEPIAKKVHDTVQRAGLSGIEHLYIDSLTAQKRLIEAGFGFGLVPISSAVEELKIGALREIDLPELKTEIPVMMLTRKEQYRSPGLEHLIERLKHAGVRVHSKASSS